MRVALQPLSGKILVSIKRSRLQAESARLKLQNGALDTELQLRGFNVKSLHASHAAHQRSVDAIVRSLETRKLSYVIEYAKELTSSSMKDVVFAISVGGDGTLLETAQMVRGPSVPVLGINSDPLHSTGKLCAAALRDRSDFEQYLHRVECKNFSWLFRSRISLVLVSSEGTRFHVDRHALNEILVAEKDVCRPTMHQTKIDSNPFGSVQRSCGVLVCSGSGSTAWMHSASAVRVDDTALILEAAGYNEVELTAPRIANMINREFILSPTSENVMFHVREALFTSPDQDKNANVRRGVARRVSVM